MTLGYLYVLLTNDSDTKRNEKRRETIYELKDILMTRVSGFGAEDGMPQGLFSATPSATKMACN